MSTRNSSRHLSCEVSNELLVVNKLRQKLLHDGQGPSRTSNCRCPMSEWCLQSWKKNIETKNCRLSWKSPLQQTIWWIKRIKQLFLVLERGELFSFVLDFGKLLVLTFNTLESGSECWIPECLKGEKATTSKFIYKWPSK